MRPMTPLCELARKHQTDKGGRHTLAGQICHEYTPVYWDLLNERRHNVYDVLEIGVNTGASLRMWAEFFPCASIVGLDNNLSTLFIEGHIKTCYADQSSPGSLHDAMRSMHMPYVDLIVDDGSHDPAHQVITLNALLPYLRPHGLYVVEDMVVNPVEIAEHIQPGFRARVITCDAAIGPAVYRPELLVVEHV